MSSRGIMNQPEPFLSHFERHVLDNGLVVLLREDDTVSVVTSMIWYKVGASCESAGQRGISHLLEHMMFKGTDRFAKGEIDAVTTRNGGVNNAFTSSDATAYYFSFAADRWLAALDIEASRMRGNAFDPKEFEAERKVVIEELKMDLDSPWGSLRREVELASFDRHPYRYPVIGLLEDLQALTMDQLVSHYRDFYAPNNAVLVLVGDFDSPRALEEVNRRFAGFPASEINLPEVDIENRPTGQRRLEVHRPARVTRLLISFPCPAASQQDFYAMQVLDKVLSEGKLSRLYRLVEEKQVVSMASTEINETRDPYLYYLSLELRSRADSTEVEQMILEELDDLVRRPLPEEDLRRAVNQCRASALEDFESSLDQAIQLGLMEVLCGTEYWSDYLHQIGRVRGEDIQRAARRYLDPERAVVGLCRKSLSGDGDGL